VNASQVPLYVAVLSGFFSILVAVTTYVLTGRAAARKARADREASALAELSAVQVKKLENDHAKEAWRHDDINAVQAEWMDCVKARATCEADLRGLQKENEGLRKELAEAEQANRYLQYENAEQKQKLSYSKFIDELGHMKPDAIIEFGQQMKRETNE
jgi:Cu/Ag efflux protein CusF